MATNQKLSQALKGNTNAAKNHVKKALGSAVDSAKKVGSSVESGRQKLIGKVSSGIEKAVNGAKAVESGRQKLIGAGVAGAEKVRDTVNAVKNSKFVQDASATSKRRIGAAKSLASDVRDATKSAPKQDKAAVDYATKVNNKRAVAGNKGASLGAAAGTIAGGVVGGVKGIAKGLKSGALADKARADASNASNSLGAKPKTRGEKIKSLASTAKSMAKGALAGAKTKGSNGMRHGAEKGSSLGAKTGNKAGVKVADAIRKRKETPAQAAMLREGESQIKASNDHKSKRDTAKNRLSARVGRAKRSMGL